MPLSPKRKLAIRQSADALLLESEVAKTLPINTEGVARFLDFSVKAFTPDESTAGVSGAVDHSGKTIFINNTESPVRQHFTLAHEIGHIRLHGGKSVIDFRDDLLVPRDDHEREANLFAAELLMPSDMFFRHWIDHTGDTKLIGRAFGVSEEAAKIRALDLGLR